MDEKKFMELFMNSQNELQKVKQCNEYTGKFGLQLSQKDAIELTEKRKAVLKEQERVEFGEGILHRLIFEFCDSAYIYQENYVETIARLQEIFYLYKNESLDELSDDELLEIMKEKFEGECGGSLDELEDTSLEGFARDIRANGCSFMGSGIEEDE